MEGLLERGKWLGMVWGMEGVGMDGEVGWERDRWGSREEGRGRD